MSTQAIEIRPSEALAVTSDQLTLARSTVARGLDENQFALFLYNCKRQGIHPLDNLLVPIVRTDNGERKLTFVTTVDLLRSRAAESGEYAGNDDAVFGYSNSQAMPDSATMTVWRFVAGEKCQFTATARWTEYYPGDKQGFMWRNKPHVMLGKCAEALALRKAFPKQLAGLYISEELQQESSVLPEPQPVRSTQRRPPVKQEIADVICGSCGGKNGHASDCKYASRNAAKPASAEAQPPAQAQTQPQPTETAAPQSEPQNEAQTQTPAIPPDGVAAYLVTKLTAGVTKQGTNFITVEAVDSANYNRVLYCFSKSIGEALTQYGLNKVCLLKTEEKNGKTKLADLVEIAGTKYQDGKPVNAAPVEEGW